MAYRRSGKEGQVESNAAAAIASQILARADRDVAFTVQLVGESRHILVQHFVRFIESELGQRGVVYGAHPLLRPFIETHARELTDFVLNGVSLRHQFGLQALERMTGDPLRLLRVDLWDSLQSHIDDAQRHFVSDAGGMLRILQQIDGISPAPGNGNDV
ncbi:hypothetical protein I6F35_05590 [Bradyrhizobium sp. BRP22]|uniref:hypothetical protein n=1 Tax=Bradyrhizobium sp. BRP22 TaxID=2793821 RepID=UPI001CD4275A|nr:hypothetical protein [Bradyrhizobium sp. BRP22]MCA1452691.1 hypothetical protein [Bradyrhizobium sp. BRP22]